MNEETSYANGESSTSSEPKDRKARIDPSEILRRARAILAELPTDVDARTKSHPYAALGVAAGIGFGAGVLLSSRILRAALASGIAYAAAEFGRTYLRQMLGDLEPKSGVGRATRVS